MGGYVDLIKARSPYAYWTHEEASGSPADSSGNGRTLVTQTGAPTYGAVPLLGTDGRKSIDYANSWITGMTGGDWWSGLGSAFTLEAWLLRNSLSTTQTIFGNLSHPAPILRMVGTAGDVEWWSSSAGSAVTWPAALPDAQRVHLIDFTYDDSSKASELIVDGVSLGVKTAAQAIANTTAFIIGSDNFSNGLNAKIAHVAIYGSILSVKHFRQSYKYGRAIRRPEARNAALRVA